MIRRETGLLIRDELVGFARSRVMLVLWVLLPALATVGYLVFPRVFAGGGGAGMPLSVVMGALLSGLGGLVAAVMVAVDLIQERERKVYELFVIRPIAPEAIVWAKFAAVFGCLTVACVVALLVGVAVDRISGVELTGELLRQTARSLGVAAGVIAISTAVGVFCGVLVRSVLVAVILVVYVGQNLQILPLLPVLFDFAEYTWILWVLTVGATLAITYFAGVLFRRAQH